MAVAGDTRLGIIPNNSNILKFPMDRQIAGNLSVTVDYVKERDVKEIHCLLKSMADEGGQGLGRDQFQEEEDLRHMLNQGANLCFKDKGCMNKIFAFLNIVDSPLVRSSKSVLHAGYVVVHKDYQSIGVSKHISDMFYPMGMSLGYLGLLGRVVMVFPRALIIFKKVGTYLGTIPDGSHLADRGWVDDIITYLLYSNTQVSIQDQSSPVNSSSDLFVEKCLPELTEIGKHNLSLMQYKSDVFQGKHLGSHTWHREKTKLQRAVSTSDLVHVEELVRQAAQDGHGFALDEFREDGLLNRKMLRESVTLVAHERSGLEQIVGGAIIGPSALCRSAHPRSLGGYIVVDPQYRQQGYGRDILHMLEDIARQLNYANILTEVYLSDKGEVQFTVKNGYLITGHVPRMGYLKGQGYTSGVIIHKKLTFARL